MTGRGERVACDRKESEEEKGVRISREVGGWGGTGKGDEGTKEVGDAKKEGRTSRARERTWT